MEAVNEYGVFFSSLLVVSAGAAVVVAAEAEVEPSVAMVEASFGPVGEVSTKDSPITRKRIFSPESRGGFGGRVEIREEEEIGRLADGRRC